MEMHDKDWDGQIEYLKNTRDYFGNDDYFEFLVHSVWKLNTPINIIDFYQYYRFWLWIWLSWLETVKAAARRKFIYWYRYWNGFVD